MKILSENSNTSGISAVHYHFTNSRRGMLVGERYEDYATGPAVTAYPVSGKSSLLEENRLEFEKTEFSWLTNE